jgi:MFS transporter, ACS family, hexuronate transporter
MKKSPAKSKKGVGHIRWVICGLLFLATTVNYIHRQVLGILAPDLQVSIGWTEVQYGHIVTAFQAAYALGLLLAGRVLDSLGTRLGFSLAIGLWSLAAMGQALARTPFGFGMARFWLGLGEAANFPAGVKTVAEWFPKKERALATGFFNAGSNVGAIVAPLMVSFITLTWGWPWAFVVTGALGFLWLALWWRFYRAPESHPRLSKAEFTYIRNDSEKKEKPMPWLALMGYRQSWAFAAGKFLTDPIWWFYLSWLPKFLHDQYNITLSKMGPPLATIYILADLGSILGGWLSSSLIRRGWSLNASRKTALLACALCAVPIVFAAKASTVWGAVALIGLAAAAHQGWSANLYTLVSDMFPRRAVGSAVGFGSVAGAVSGMAIATAVGYLLQWTGSYMPVFLMAGFAYLITLAVIQALAPQLEPVTFGRR